MKQSALPGQAADTWRKEKIFRRWLKRKKQKKTRRKRKWGVKKRGPRGNTNKHIINTWELSLALSFCLSLPSPFLSHFHSSVSFLLPCAFKEQSNAKQTLSAHKFSTHCLNLNNDMVTVNSILYSQCKSRSIYDSASVTVAGGLDSSVSVHCNYTCFNVAAKLFLKHVFKRHRQDPYTVKISLK